MKKWFWLIPVFTFVFVISCKDVPEENKKETQEKINYLNETDEDFDQRMKWWRDSRYGMFVHWGVYAVPAGVYNGKEIEGIGEWIMRRGQIPVDEYEQFAKSFNPVKFDANEWVKIIKNAGMKYLVITSKHHDGFGLWDSEVSDYNIVDFAPYGKDVLKALSEACKEQGIKFGLYHSILDWHHPDAQAYSYLKDDPRKREDNKENFANYLETHMKPQLKELVDNYDPEILWFDGEWIGEFTHEQGQQLYQYVRELKPSIIINNRVDKGRAGMQGMNKEGSFAGDFGTPEQEILEKASVLDWESCMTMNDTWGFKKNDHNWKSAETLIHNLIDIVAKGGNYLLNVGPTEEGLIPGPSVERLKATGDWLAINGEAIYETEKFSGAYKQGESLRFTKKKNGDFVYAITLEKPELEVHLQTIKPEPGSTIEVLGTKIGLKWTYTEGQGTIISIPSRIQKLWNENTHAWTFKIQGSEI